MKSIISRLFLVVLLSANAQAHFLDGQGWSASEYKRLKDRALIATITSFLLGSGGFVGGRVLRMKKYKNRMKRLRRLMDMLAWLGAASTAASAATWYGAERGAAKLQSDEPTQEVGRAPFQGNHAGPATSLVRPMPPVSSEGQLPFEVGVATQENTRGRAGQHKPSQDAHTCGYHLGSGRFVFGVYDGHGENAVGGAYGLTDFVNSGKRVADDAAEHIKISLQDGKSLTEAYKIADAKILKEIPEVAHPDNSGVEHASNQHILEETTAIIGVEHAQNEYILGGTTAITCVVDTQSMTITTANIGDSAAVLSSSGTAMVLGGGHKNALKGSEQKGAKYGIGGYGFSREKEYSVERNTSTDDHDITRDDQFIILACDGIWDVVPAQEAVDFVRDVLAAGNTHEVAAQKLMTLATAKGSKDDMSVIIVSLEGISAL